MFGVQISACDFEIWKPSDFEMVKPIDLIISHLTFFRWFLLTYRFNKENFHFSRQQDMDILFNLMNVFYLNTLDNAMRRVDR